MRPYFSLMLVTSFVACNSDHAGGQADGGGDSMGAEDAGNRGDAASDPGKADDSGSAADDDDDDDDEGPGRDAGPPSRRCEGGTYTTAPSGAACDPSHFTFRDCAGPPLGMYCDLLIVQIGQGEQVPEGFECEAAFEGKRRCEWMFSSTGHNLDEPALEAVCALTVSEPPHQVACILLE
jgi:hypothetical protein